MNNFLPPQTRPLLPSLSLVAALSVSLAGEPPERPSSGVLSRAEAVSKQFGFAGYTVREVTVNTDSGGSMPMVRVRAMAVASDDAALPTEAGKATVTATVSGSVQMVK